MIDLSQSFDSIKSTIESFKTYKEVSDAEKELRKSAGNSDSPSLGASTSQLTEVEKSKKRFQRSPETSLDRMLNLLSTTRGNGDATLRYLRKKMIEVYLKLEPKAVEILSEETIKVLGCSQEQTYEAVSTENYDINNIPSSIGLYLPVTNLDIFGNLKNDVNTIVGKDYYEKQQPSGDITFKPFGGKVPFPMNKMLNTLMDSSNSGRSLSSFLGKNYSGKSGQPLFDVVYTKNDSFGITGDYFRFIMLDRTDTPTNEQGTKLNKVGQFINDYYSTIKIVDPVNVTLQLVNLLTSAVNINVKVGYGELNENSRFALLIQRILGLCFDNRTEIDVSGVSKIAELDGVNDDFWELNEIDLRFIDSQISDTQNGVIEFEGCDGIKLPVNSDVLVNQILEFRETFNEGAIDENTKKIESILDSIVENPEWKTQFLSSIGFNVQVNKNILKLIPQALVSAILTPKTLLPIFVLLSALAQKNEKLTNQGIVLVNNLSIKTPTDFLIKFKEFNIQVISRINSEFLKILFEILKKDIINLLSVIISDINKSGVTKRYTIFLRLVQLLLIVVPAIGDYKKCKSLLDDILQLLNLINTGAGRGFFPSTALLAATFLPGTSPERSGINVFQFAQKVGLPTGALPDGSPNLMNQFVMSLIRGVDKEENENGKVESVLKLPPQLGGGLIQTVGKKF